MALLGLPVAVAALVILIGVIVLANRDGSGGGCADEPAVCDAVREYAAAFNERDAAALLAVLTDRGLRNLLDAVSEKEMAQRLRLLSPADRIEGVEITRVTLEGDRASVVALYRLRDEEFSAVYRLVRADSRWLIDG